MMVGMDTFTMLLSITAMKVPIMTMNNTHHL